ncbi:aldo/keto reductase [Sulfodiicoccus acidiphilus]|uniref:Aldo/keto reductase n=1 Tax=Sulfodiicoccus acidiphilus TaxID=1670455 RepID=A0A348B5U0_9CREN|nr:aldo/keto reductase [Sulfodiicoccus acidiphilus]BBD73542.1 aldo/keto reductase [Sulfodiicoccus acidiphilus]GGT92417.1 aldo/keto reductase [Sulfodiicoccus acidiphilus]
MERKKLGWTGEEISPLILGTFEHGVRTLVSEEEAVKLLNRAIELGINAFDTAESYGKGESERVLGKVIKGVKRDEVFLITKVSPEHLRYDDVLKSAERSMRRLDVSYIDLYLVHWPNHYVPLRETAKAMEKLVNDGKVRYVGVSNFSLPLLREFREHLSRTDVAADEVHYNLLFRAIEEEVYPYASREGIPILAYDPLGLGYLVGRREIRDEYRWYFLAKDGVVEALAPLVEEVRKTAERLGLTPAQVLLGWLTSKELVFPVFNTTKQKHLEENVGFRETPLDAIQSLESISTKVWLDLRSKELV